MFKKYPIEAQFTGPDPAVLHQLADSARKIMENCPDVYLITTDWEPQIPVLTIEYDQPTARAIGLSRNDVSLSLLTATSGIPIGSFYEGIHKDNIYLRCLDEHGNPIENLRQYADILVSSFSERFADTGNDDETEDRNTIKRRTGGNVDGNNSVKTNQ